MRHDASTFQSHCRHNHARLHSYKVIYIYRGQCFCGVGGWGGWWGWLGGYLEPQIIWLKNPNSILPGFFTRIKQIHSRDNYYKQTFDSLQFSSSLTQMFLMVGGTNLDVECGHSPAFQSTLTSIRGWCGALTSSVTFFKYLVPYIYLGSRWYFGDVNSGVSHRSCTALYGRASYGVSFVNICEAIYTVITSQVDHQN